MFLFKVIFFDRQKKLKDFGMENTSKFIEITVKYPR